MFLLKMMRKFGKVLRGGVAPRQIALGAVLGVVLGMLPGFSLTTVLAIVLLLVLNAHVGLALLGFALGKVCCLLLAPVTFHIGYFIIHRIGLEGLFRALSSTPVLALLDLHVYSLTGGLPVAVLLGLAFAWAMVRAVNGLRATISGATDRSERLRRVGENKIVRAFMWLVFGRLKGDLSEMMTARPSWIRKSGVIVAVVVFVLIGGVQFLLSGRLVEVGVQKGGGAVNGAEVNLADAQFSLRRGLVELQGLQVTDPSEPSRNRFQSERMIAQLSVADLLRKRYVMSEVTVRDVETDTQRETPGEVYIPPEQEEPVDEEEAEGKSLYDYIEMARKARPYLRKLEDFLEARQSEEKQEESALRRARNRGYLSMSARDLLATVPSWLVRELNVEGVSIPGLPGLQDVHGERLTGQPELLDEPMTLSMTPRDGEQPVVSVQFNFHEPGTPHQFTLNLEDFPIGQGSGLQSAGPVSIREGRVMARAAGTFSSKGIELPFVLKLSGLQADTQEGLLGMDAEASSRVLQNVSELEVVGVLRGSLRSPRVSIDAKKTMASLQQALTEAGKAELARMAGEQLKGLEEEVGGALREQLKERLPGGLPGGLPGLPGRQGEGEEKESEEEAQEGDTEETLKSFF